MTPRLIIIWLFVTPHQPSPKHILLELKTKKLLYRIWAPAIRDVAVNYQDRNHHHHDLITITVCLSKPNCSVEKEVRFHFLQRYTQLARSWIWFPWKNCNLSAKAKVIETPTTSHQPRSRAYTPPKGHNLHQQL